MWLIPILPLLAAALIPLLGATHLRRHSHWPCLLASSVGFVIAVGVLFPVLGGGQPLEEGYVWADVDNVNVRLTLQADGLTALMLVMVTFIGTLIAIYSVGYMQGDSGYSRYFAEISLFLASMTGLVLADNLILLYACWEGVGLCSYLLIGFWFQRPRAAAAARKAFLVTRLGDVGFFLGILLLWSHAGTLSLSEAFARPDLSSWPLFTICLLLFCGAVGKSAQFPLHVWLPDAMEGPSPVSALIHAATMVTAGVYLVARCTPLFVHAPSAQLVVAVIGGFTALLAALMALTQTDLKRVLAYSTISQLGYLFLALGCARHDSSHHINLVSLAVAAAIFHLFTHAFFKALLFLAAGSVMHAMGDVIDMRQFSGLKQVLPTTHWTFLCGAAALAGVPLLSGFWSKDEILLAVLSASEVSSIYVLLFVTALLTAGLTAFYTFRAYYLTFHGELQLPLEAGHGHEGVAPTPGHEAGHKPSSYESPPVMLIPLVILAIGALVVGLVLAGPHLFGGPHLFADVLREHAKNTVFRGLPEAEHHHGPNLVLMLGSILFALGGIGLAYYLYVARRDLPGQLARSVPVGYELSRNRFFLDEIYNILIVKPLTGLSHLFGWFDLGMLDQLVDLLAQIPVLLGKLFSPIQNGLVQFYALLMVLALTGFLISVLLR